MSAGVGIIEDQPFVGERLLHPQEIVPTADVALANCGFGDGMSALPDSPFHAIDG